MLLSCHQNARQNHDIKIVNRTFENVELIFFAKYNQNDQVKEDKMERECSMNGGE
jgi:hypothetical protein